jgi:hypothetical protein
LRITAASSRVCYPTCAVRMLWWFLILGVSLVLVVSVAVSLYMRLRKQMKDSAALRAESDGPDDGSHKDLPPEA